jgi:hypothetical protein
VFCAACGRNLNGVERLPTRREWEAEHGGGADERPLEERSATALADFLAAMHAAGNPGAAKRDVPPRRVFRQPTLEGWVVRPVERNDEVQPRQYRPGLFLTVDGTFHRLDSELRGFGQRDFPTYYETVAAEPMPMPVEQRLIDELDALLRARAA